jgi:hypothetical protein
MTKNLKKLTAGKINFYQKTTIYLSLCLSYRRILQPSKDNMQHFKTWNFLIFFFFGGRFCPPGSESGYGSTALIGSGSEILVYRSQLTRM